MRASMLLLLILPALVWADDGSLRTRSAAGYAVGDAAVSQLQRLETAGVIESARITKPRLLFGVSGADSDIQARTVAAHPGSVAFEIFDAWVELSGDLDHDGYYHRINVVLDADTTAALETVYVKLYLSHEGGDWVQYATSDLFDIYFDSIDDTYEVVTELIEGFPPGYYDVLIELHSLYHPEIVASRIIDGFTAGAGIALEDLEHDDAQRLAVSVEGYAYGTGSISTLGLIMYGLLLLLKLRYFRGEKLEE